MKRITIFIAALLCSCLSLSAQTISSEGKKTGAKRTNLIVTNPLKFIQYLNISYYRSLTENITVGGELLFPVAAMEKYSGFGTNLEMRYYPEGNWIRGFYFGPTFGIKNLSKETSGDYNSETGEYETGTKNYTPTSIGLILGWQTLFFDNFAIGYAVGVDRYTETYDAGFSDDALIKSQIVPVVRLDAGFAF